MNAINHFLELSLHGLEMEMSHTLIISNSFNTNTSRWLFINININIKIKIMYCILEAKNATILIKLEYYTYNQCFTSKTNNGRRGWTTTRIL